MATKVTKKISNWEEFIDSITVKRVYPCWLHRICPANCNKRGK